MKYYLLFLLLGIHLSGISQKVDKKYYDSGKIKSEVTSDESGLMLKQFFWDPYGNLLVASDYSKEYTNYPKLDYAKIKWTPVVKGVYIYKYNVVDTNIVLTDSSHVILNYQCYISNGKMIDNSFERGCPLDARLDQLTIGFMEGVKMMKPGETALVKMSPETAYGSKAQGNVPANSTLYYLIKLISAD